MSLCGAYLLATGGPESPTITWGRTGQASRVVPPSLLLVQRHHLLQPKALWGEVPTREFSYPSSRYTSLSGRIIGKSARYLLVSSLFSSQITLQAVFLQDV
ncbi:hypothetical protein FKM82_029277 [Ascaphus truei]